MAIWQYKLFILPREEVISYFGNALSITEEALNEVEWWKYRQIGLDKFDPLLNLIPLGKSWSKEIILLGNEYSDFVELLHEKDKIFEISARIDLRSNYTQFLSTLCEVADENNCCFVNDSLKILPATISIVQYDIENYGVFQSFIDKLND